MKESLSTDEVAISGVADEESLKNDVAPGGMRSFFLRTVPAFDSLRTYTWATFRADLFSGLTVAAVAVPQAMAYALIAGIPPEYGLYTAIVVTTVGALLDSSKQLINGPTNAISIALLSALAPIPDADKLSAAILMALLVGVTQTGITLLRLGDLTRFISHAVIVGFTVGASVLLVLDQLKNFLGMTAKGSPHDHFLTRFWLTISQGEINQHAAAIAVATVILVLTLRWLSNRIGVRLPEFLIAVVVMAAAVWAGGLTNQGVRVVGEIPARLPTFQVPRFEWVRVRELTGSALAIAVLGLLEALAMAKAIASQTGQKLDINQQCLSEGLANFAGSFFQCFPGSGSLTRSAINQQTGAVSQWSGVISAAAVALMVLAFAPLAYYIPYSCLAGILMVTATRIVDQHQLVYHLRTTRFDAGIVLATALSAVLVSVEFCILIGVFLSFLFYVPRAARIHLSELTLTPERVLREKMPSDPRCGRILIYDLEGEFFFGAAPDLEQHLAAIGERARDGVRVVVLRLKRARNPDAVCLGLLDDFLARMEARRVTVLLCGVRRELAAIFHKIKLANRLGPKRIFHENADVGSSTIDAVRHAYDLLAGDFCSNCPRRGEKATQETLYYMI